jgi:N-acetyltransferase
MSGVKRTYGSKATRDVPGFPPSSPSSELASSPGPASARKRSHLDDSITNNMPPAKKGFLSRSSSSSGPFPSRSGHTQRRTKKAPAKESGTQKQLTQLHFALETSVLQTCPLCSLTYTRGAPDDETLHRAHCARVQKGMEWGKEEEREWKSGKVSIEEVANGIRLKNGTKGRVMCFRADVGGKVGAKVPIHLPFLSLND